MTRVMIVLFLAAALLPATSGCESLSRQKQQHAAHEDGVTKSHVSIDEVPPAVRAGFEREFPGAQVQAIEKEVYAHGTVHYEFKFTHNGKAMKVEFDEDGDPLPEH